MRLLFCGDIMPGGVLPYQENYIDTALLEWMGTFDFRIGTLECAIGDNLPYDEVKMQGRMNIIYARNKDLFRIKEMGFDVVSLANNHVWDMGEEGLRNTMHQLDELGIRYCGAGMNVEEATRPVVLQKNGVSVAILAYCMYNNPWLGYVEVAGEGKPGVAPLDIERVLSDIVKAKKQYDKVVVMPHWGKEYRYTPMPESVAMTKQMIKAGADAVLGGHPHQVQSYIKMRGVPVCFSLGNFLFPDFYMKPPRPIWYPDASVDRSAIPDVEDYPFPVEQAICRVWKPLSRYSRMIEMEVRKSRLMVKSHFSYTTSGNVVTKSGASKNMKKHLWKEAGMIKYGFFKRIVAVVQSLKS